MPILLLRHMLRCLVIATCCNMLRKSLLIHSLRFSSSFVQTIVLLRPDLVVTRAPCFAVGIVSARAVRYAVAITTSRVQASRVLSACGNAIMLTTPGLHLAGPDRSVTESAAPAPASVLSQYHRSPQGMPPGIRWRLHLSFS
eukprot:2828325-Pleurochrysis_carterae.AAC.1